MIKQLAKKLLRQGHYDGYRPFLGDLYQALRERRKGFNHEVFAEALGLSSGSQLNQIINGHRKLSAKQRDLIVDVRQSISR